MHPRTAAEHSTDPVLELGDPRLRRRACPVIDFAHEQLAGESARLLTRLAVFRRQHGFGRAIAAPQIGIARRLIALDLPHWQSQPFVICNPEIVWASPETVTLWDDCMSFPGLLVRVRRHRSVSVSYCDAGGRVQLRENLRTSDAELLQHEIDHLDGVLATDLALDREALVTRASFAAQPALFAAMVDHPPRAC